MNFPKNIGMVLLAVYLVMAGLIGLFGINLGQLSVVMPILALASGIMIFIGR